MFDRIANLYHRVARSLLRTLNTLTWIGPLLVRVTLGVVFATTGWGKLHNLETVTGFFASLNIPAPAFHAVFVSAIEFAGGLLLIAGLATRVASGLLIAVMAVAIYTAKLSELSGPVDLANTIEFTYLVMFVWLAVSGAGAVSIDRWIARRSASEPRVGVAA